MAGPSLRPQTKLGNLKKAAWNKLRFTPVLLRGENGTALKLRQSVRLEAVLFGAILKVVAAITTLSAPETPDQTAVVMAS